MLLAYLMLNDARICPINSKQSLAQILKSIEQVNLFFFLLFIVSTRSSLFTLFLRALYTVALLFSFQPLVPACCGWSASVAACFLLSLPTPKFGSTHTLAVDFKSLSCLNICQLRLGLSPCSSSFSLSPRWSFPLCFDSSSVQLTDSLPFPSLWHLQCVLSDKWNLLFN